MPSKIFNWNPLLRCWAFLLPWALVLGFPQLREPLRLQLFGSPVAPSLVRFWNFDQEADVLRPPTDLPSNLDNDVWRLWDKCGRWNRIVPTRDLVSMESKLCARYPGERWLPAFCLWCYPHTSEGQKFVHGNDLGMMARLAIRSEPNNAFPDSILWLDQCRDLSWLRAFTRWKRASPALVLAENSADSQLHVAASQDFYDDHLTDAMACIVRANQALRARSELAIEEKIWMVGHLDQEDHGYYSSLAEDVKLRADNFVRRGDPARAVQMMTDMRHMGAMMESGRNCLSINRQSGDYVSQSATWRPEIKFGSSELLNLGAAASVFGGVRVRKVLDVDDQREWRFNDVVNYFGDSFSLNTGQYNSLWPFIRLDVGVALLWQSLLILAVWLPTATLLAGGVSQPSSLQDRSLVALAGAFISGLLAHYTVYYLRYNAVPGWRHQVFVACAVLAVVAPALLSWFCCALVTYWRHRKIFAAPGEAEQHLSLDRNSAALLNHAPKIAAWFCYLFLLAAAMAWARVCKYNETPWYRNSYRPNMPLEHYLTFAVLYGLGLAGAATLAWIFRWRFSAAPHSRPLAHAALRWWKESMGAYLIVLAWLYLFIAIIHIPLRDRAMGQVAGILRDGEITTLVEKPR